MFTFIGGTTYISERRLKGVCQGGIWCGRSDPLPSSMPRSNDLKPSLQTLPPDLSIPAKKSSSSPATTPPTVTPLKGKPAKRKKEADIGVTQFIFDLPRAEEQALKEFELLPENTFQYKGLGRSNQQVEMMVCDCAFDPADDDPEDACGPHSNCINRLTQVECLKYECQTKEYCQNQRFSKKQYAAVEVVQTEKKGYGLRAGADISADEFVYEYIGEVVSQTSFLKRMQQYADEGIQHFYFMMLQREEVQLCARLHTRISIADCRLPYPFDSISTRQRKVVSLGLPTTHAIRTVMSRNGLWASVCGWVSSPSVTFNVAKN